MNSGAVRRALFSSLILALFFALSLASQSADARVNKSARAGTSWIFIIEGNPSTGYVWRRNEGKSENLAIVKVEDLGYGESERKAGKKRYGAPSPYRFRITELAPGFARLHFEYLRPSTGSSSKTEDCWVHVE